MRRNLAPEGRFRTHLDQRSRVVSPAHPDPVRRAVRVVGSTNPDQLLDRCLGSHRVGRIARKPCRRPIHAGSLPTLLRRRREANECDEGSLLARSRAGTVDKNVDESCVRLGGTLSGESTRVVLGRVSIRFAGLGSVDRRGRGVGKRAQPDGVVGRSGSG